MRRKAPWAWRASRPINVGAPLLARFLLPRLTGTVRYHDVSHHAVPVAPTVLVPVPWSAAPWLDKRLAFAIGQGVIRSITSSLAALELAIGCGLVHLHLDISQRLRMGELA